MASRYLSTGIMRRIAYATKNRNDHPAANSMAVGLNKNTYNVCTHVHMKSRECSEGWPGSRNSMCT